MTETFIAIDDLQIGHFINLPVGWTSHPFLLNSFQIKDQKQLAILKQLGFTEICVDLNRSDITLLDLFSFPDTDSDHFCDTGILDEVMTNTESAEIERKKLEQEELRKAQEQERQHQQNLWWKQIRLANTEYEAHTTNLKEIYSQLTLQPERSLTAVELMAGKLIQRAEQTGKTTFILCNSAIPGETFYQNALNITVLGIKLAQQLNLPPTEVATVAQAGLLSHFGMLWVPDSIRNKKAELTKPEINFLRQHPAYAFQKLSDIHLNSEPVLTAVWQFNEKMDGSGYPRGISGNKISKYAQILAICTRYNDMCNANNAGQRFSPHLIVGYLFKIADKQFNKAYVEQFIRMVGIYPVGTVVAYNKHQALVCMAITSQLKQPLLMDFSALDPNSKRPLLLDAAAQKITISQGLKQDQIQPPLIKKFHLNERSNIYFG